MNTETGHALPAELYIKEGRIQHDEPTDHKDHGISARVTETERDRAICDALVSRYNAHSALVEALRESLDRLHCIVDSCDEAIDGRWDRSEEGFEAMRSNSLDLELKLRALLSQLEADK